jgi:hypothetical protein
MQRAWVISFISSKILTMPYHAMPIVMFVLACAKTCSPHSVLRHKRPDGRIGSTPRSGFFSTVDGEIKNDIVYDPVRRACGEQPQDAAQYRSQSSKILVPQSILHWMRTEGATSIQEQFELSQHVDMIGSMRWGRGLSNILSILFPSLKHSSNICIELLGIQTYSGTNAALISPIAGTKNSR